MTRRVFLEFLSSLTTLWTFFGVARFLDRFCGPPLHVFTVYDGDYHWMYVAETETEALSAWKQMNRETWWDGEPDLEAECRVDRYFPDEIIEIGDVKKTAGEWAVALNRGLIGWDG